ncbi:MAG: hypothetical protein ABF264_07970 [Flavobacteriales bacterium]|jgi:hypothetical protein
MKTIKLTTLILAAALVFGSTSCKYEEGPGLSLRTKTARVAGEWTIEKIIYADGTEDTDNFDYTYSFDKDGTGKINFSGSSVDFNWDLVDSKEKIKIDIDGFGSSTETILRLTNKEMWLKDSDNDQTHLKSK